MLDFINFFCLLTLLMLFILTLNVTSNLHLITLSELFWITYYAIALFTSYYYDDLNLLGLTLFFLVFSSVEISLALVFILFQNIFNKDSLTNLTPRRLRLFYKRGLTSKVL